MEDPTRSPDKYFSRPLMGDLTGGDLTGKGGKSLSPLLQLCHEFLHLISGDIMFSTRSLYSMRSSKDKPRGNKWTVPY